MAYSELIKNFNKIRDYMRDFYVYGFKSRDDYTKKSARSYDDEKRRIESWLGNYMKFHQTADGKNVFLSIDSRATKHNPLYKAWKTKSFTDGDITLHFIVMDILSNGQELSLGDVAYQVDEYLAAFEHARVFDISTIRKKLNEYVKEGLLVRHKSGKTMLYSRTEEFEMPSRDVLDFFSETAPCGVIGSFLEDKTNNIADYFVFKHHYIKQYAKIVCNMLGLKESEYRKTLSTLRAYLNVVEVKMSAGEWEDINYSNLPSRANLLYGNAFLRNDEERRRAFLSKLSRGDVTINASTLFPSDIVHKYYQASSKRRCELGNFDDTLEGLWNSLPNFIEGDNSTLVVRDGSGSMDTTVGNTNVTALEVSTALAIYFSEHLTGHFYNKFITFSSRPAMIDMSNATCVRDKLEICEAHSDCSNTDLKAVFDLILNTAVENKLNQSELPKNILIVSDMEFDSMMGTYSRWGSYNQDDSSTKTLLESIAAEYQAYGYTLPRLIFWNVCSRTNTIMLQENEAGVALVSGFNPAVYNMVLSNELDPYKCLLKQINSERYDAIENILCA